MQGIIFKKEETAVKRGDKLPVFLDGNIICHFKVESFTDTQVVGDFTINVEANLQFIVITDSEGYRTVVTATQDF